MKSRSQKRAHTVCPFRRGLMNSHRRGQCVSKKFPISTLKQNKAKQKNRHPFVKCSHRQDGCKDFACPKAPTDKGADFTDEGLSQAVRISY